MPVISSMMHNLCQLPFLTSVNLCCLFSFPHLRNKEPFHLNYVSRSCVHKFSARRWTNNINWRNETRTLTIITHAISDQKGSYYYCSNNFPENKWTVPRFFCSILTHSHSFHLFHDKTQLDTATTYKCTYYVPTHTFFSLSTGKNKIIK